MKRRDVLRVAVGAGVLLTTGCYGAAVEHEWGWTTREVSGVVSDAQTGAPLENSFVVLQEFYGTFAPDPMGGQRFAPKARLLFPDEQGRFRFNFDLRASQLELTFVAEKYVSERFRFQRQLGVGDVRYDAALQATSNWRDEVLLVLTPLVQNLLLEARYRLPERDQLWLGDWLAAQREKIIEAAPSDSQTRSQPYDE